MPQREKLRQREITSSNRKVYCQLSYGNNYESHDCVKERCLCQKWLHEFYVITYVITSGITKYNSMYFMCWIGFNIKANILAIT